MSPLIGIDYGRRRTGIAVSDETDTLATAVRTHCEGRDGSLFDMLQELVTDRNVTGFVLGLPLTADGREMEMAERTRSFAEKLQNRFQLPVHFMDERFSSREARHYLNEGGRRRRDRAEVDAVAAEIILQRYLDAGGAAVEDEDA